MFKIRREQKVAFVEDAISSFEDRVVLHVRELFPDRIGSQDDVTVRARIRAGIARAATHGIVAERGVCAFIDVMFLHGDGFESDRRRPWAAAILQDRGIRSPVERAARLLDTAFAAARRPMVVPAANEPGFFSARAEPSFAVPPPAVRRAIIEVRWGPFAARKVAVLPGQQLVVGRSNRADLALPHDARLSGKHFSLSWDGERCRLRDLGSADGTWLQGERVGDAEVASGAWIRAGTSHLMVYFEAHSQPGPGSPLSAEQTALALRELSGASSLFGVVDASRGPQPLQLLRESVDEHRSLYDGVKGEALAHCAPYLVALRSDSGLLARLVGEGFGAQWGIYLTSTRPFLEVRRHLRRFLIAADDETGQRYYFRFYDPRTLRVFLPSCTVRQRADLFRDVDCYFAEGAHGELRRFGPEPSP